MIWHLFVISRRCRPAFLSVCLFVHPLSAAEAPWVGDTLDGTPCTGRHQGFGPFDYTNPMYRGDKLEVVERHHFTPNVEQLERGASVHELGADLSYTLSAFPNHHRALQAMARYQIIKKRARNAPYSPIECYFERAINFNPKDGNVYLLYGIYLHKLGKHSTALKNYQSAAKLQPNNIELLYNMGLLHFDLKQYKKAHRYATTAYKRGYPLLGLKNKLKKRGYWKVPMD